MKQKTLKKKIRRLEKRLREGPGKLARLKQNLQTMTTERQLVERARQVSAKGTRAIPVSQTTKRSVKVSGGKAAPKPAKAKRKLNLSLERRAQLSEAMKARWAAKRAAAPTNQTLSEPGQDYTLGEHPPTPAT